MILEQTPIPGAFVLELEAHSDRRGYFARTFDAELFAQHGLDPRVAQCSTSYNARAGTLRGMHYQAPPHPETKLIRVTRGALYDVIVDVREGSASFGRWFAIRLDSDRMRALYVPAGLAHGYQTLLDATELHYQMSTRHEPDAARGLRYDDPSIAIQWPQAPPGGLIMSERDRSFPDLR